MSKTGQVGTVAVKLSLQNQPKFSENNPKLGNFIWKMNRRWTSEQNCGE